MELFVTKKSKVFEITLYDDYPFGFVEALSDNEEIKDKLREIIAMTENEVKDKIKFASLEYQPMENKVEAKLMRATFGGEDYEDVDGESIDVITYRLKYYAEVDVDFTVEDFIDLIAPAAGVDDEVIRSYSSEIKSKMNEKNWKIKIGD